MKKIIAFLLLAVSLSTFSGCTGKKIEYSVYFAGEDGRSLVEETVMVDGDGKPEFTAEQVLKALLKGPSSADHKRVIPKETELISVHLDTSGTVTVNLSQDFEKTVGYAEGLLSRYSVVNTLCSIDGITKVQLLVNGRHLSYNTNGEDIGELSMTGVITDDDIGKNQTVVVKLYFAAQDKKGLVAEKRMIDIKDNESIGKSVVSELLKGPSENGVRAIPSDVKLLSVETKDQICYVNFSSEFLSIPSSDLDLAVYSVVNTLTDLRKATGVQFLIEGEKTDKAGVMILSEPFRYNESIEIEK